MIKKLDFYKIDLSDFLDVTSFNLRDDENGFLKQWISGLNVVKTFSGNNTLSILILFEWVDPKLINKIFNKLDISLEFGISFQEAMERLEVKPMPKFQESFLFQMVLFSDTEYKVGLAFNSDKILIQFSIHLPEMEDLFNSWNDQENGFT